MDRPPLPIRVNRAPVLTLWATVVVERLGHPPDTALTLGRFVAGSSACAKARRLGITVNKLGDQFSPRVAMDCLGPKCQHRVTPFGRG